MTSSHHGPTSRATHVLQMADTKRSDPRASEPPQSVVVRIESATRLHEVGIASNRDQNATVNTFLAL